MEKEFDISGNNDSIKVYESADTSAKTIDKKTYNGRSITVNNKKGRKVGTIVIASLLAVTAIVEGFKLANDIKRYGDNIPSKATYSDCQVVNINSKVKKSDIEKSSMVFLKAPNYVDGVMDGKFIDNLTECLENKKTVVV